MAKEGGEKNDPPYVGRIAPSPTGLLHLGHAQTFHIAQQRARQHDGRLLLRIEDIDLPRCKPEFLPQMFQDLNWLGLCWNNDATQSEYFQSARVEFYREAWKVLLNLGVIYPSPHSRKDVERCMSAPHAGEGEPVFPVELRPTYMQQQPSIYNVEEAHLAASLCPLDLQGLNEPTMVNWRFRVPDGRVVTFTDGYYGPQSFLAGRDFGDFVVWSGALGTASYELAVVVDDLAMGVTEVVRGQDLLLSTARQLLLAELLSPLLGRGQRGSHPLRYYHCPLVLDSAGKRLAKRCASTTVAGLRESGLTLEQLWKDHFDQDLLPLQPTSQPSG